MFWDNGTGIDETFGREKAPSKMKVKKVVGPVISGSKSLKTLEIGNLNSISVFLEVVANSCTIKTLVLSEDPAKKGKVPYRT